MCTSLMVKANVLGLEMVVVLVLVVWMGSYLYGQKDWSDGWKDRKEGGAGHPRDLSKEDRMRETRRKGQKMRTLTSLLLFLQGHCDNS